MDARRIPGRADIGGGLYERGGEGGRFAALLRVLVAGLPNFALDNGTSAAWMDVTWLLAAATMIVGNLIAIVQSDPAAAGLFEHRARGLHSDRRGGGGRARVADEATQSVLII